MTKEQTAQLRQLWEKSTQGNWKTEQGYCGARHQKFLVRPGCDGVSFGQHYDSTIQARYDADAEFAAAAHQRVPELLDRLEELERELEQAWKLAGMMHDVTRADMKREEGEAPAPLADLCSSCVYRQVCAMRAKGVDRCLGHTLQEATHGQR